MSVNCQERKSDLPPECRFQAIIEAQNAFISDYLGHAVQWTFVTTCAVPIL